MDTSESPGLLIHRLAHAMSLEMDRRLKEHDVTTSQWRVLKQLWQQEGRSQVELQELLGLERATVNGLVQRMERLDLVYSQVDSVDKRVQRVFLTKRGRELKAVTKSLEDDVNTSTLEGFSPDERTFFMRLLSRALLNCEK